jgi:putative membrane protein
MFNDEGENATIVPLPMMKLLLKLVITALALLGVAYLIPSITVDSFYTALIVALILGLLNLTVRPILFVLTLPITILTLGLFIFVLNALIFWFAASFIEGFGVSGFLAALIGSLLVSLASTLANKLL